MAGPLHAILLLSLVAATVTAAIRSYSKPSASRFVLSLVAGATSALGAASVALHMCGLGQPVAQWAIPGACLAASLMVIHTPALRRALVASCLFLGFALSFHYGAIVHGPTYVGSLDVDPLYEVGPIEREWHSWLTGLYRRSDSVVDAEN